VPPGGRPFLFPHGWPESSEGYNITVLLVFEPAYESCVDRVDFGITELSVMTMR
jgi:hypothetical protein